MAMRFAGFNGRPVMESTGTKAALYFDPEAKQYGVIRPGQLESRWSHEEMVDHEKRMLVSLISTDQAYEEGSVAFYAHMRFLTPLDFRLIRLPRSRTEKLELYLQLESYVTFTSPARVQEILQQWATRLLQAARASLNDGSMARKDQGKVCFQEAMRARLASPPSSERRDDRLDAFALAWIGLSYQQQSPVALLRDAAREDLHGDTTKRAAELLSVLAPEQPSSSRSYRDDKQAPYRQQEDAA